MLHACPTLSWLRWLPEVTDPSSHCPSHSGGTPLLAPLECFNHLMPVGASLLTLSLSSSCSPLHKMRHPCLAQGRLWHQGWLGRESPTRRDPSAEKDSGEETPGTLCCSQEPSQTSTSCGMVFRRPYSFLGFFPCVIQQRHNFKYCYFSHSDMRNINWPNSAVAVTILLAV